MPWMQAQRMLGGVQRVRGLAGSIHEKKQYSSKEYYSPCPHTHPVPIPSLSLSRLCVCICLVFTRICPLWLSDLAILVLKVNVNRGRRAICWPLCIGSQKTRLKWLIIRVLNNPALAFGLAASFRAAKENILNLEIHGFQLYSLVFI